MYRAILLTTLVLLLSAIAGVSVAQEGTIFAGKPKDNGPSETATPEPTSLETTGPEVTTSKPPVAEDATENRQDLPEQTVATEPTVDETTAGGPEKPAVPPEHAKTPTPGANAASMPGDGGRKVGKREHAREAPGLSNSHNRVGPRGIGKPVERGNWKPGPGPGQPKVVLCHKGKTLTVGAPAQAAHLRHGDGLGACQ